MPTWNEFWGRLREASLQHKFTLALGIGFFAGLLYMILGGA